MGGEILRRIFSGVRILKIAIGQKVIFGFVLRSTFGSNHKTIIMKKITLIAMLLLSISVFAQSKKKQILLVGAFHFENPGLDVAKLATFNVMTNSSQKELETISNKIKKFGPQKIFVEWNHEKQNTLDKLYNRSYDSLIKASADEIVQIAVRSGKKLGHKKLFAIDYHGAYFPYDSLMNAMKDAKQDLLLQENEKAIKAFETEFNQLAKTKSLTEILLALNDKKEMEKGLGLYISLMNPGGKTDNFVGAYLVSEWYRRNLYMYSLVQKLTESKDEKVMVLLGAGHIELLREFVKLDSNFELVELKDVLK